MSTPGPSRERGIDRNPLKVAVIGRRQPQGTQGHSIDHRKPDPRYPRLTADRYSPGTGLRTNDQSTNTNSFELNRAWAICSQDESFASPEIVPERNARTNCRSRSCGGRANTQR